MTSGPRYRGFPEDYLHNPDASERRVLDYWRRARVFEEQQERRKGAKPFVFYEGPPTANGKPGVHHVFARAVKDAVCRYHWMAGARVDRKAGWDTHGLPVELEVEKKLGISGKKQIEDEVGVAKFNALCKESVFTYLTEWRELSERIGYWLDYDHPYVTFETQYIETLWWILSRFAANGLLEKRFKVLPYCPRCGTGLSSHEVGQGYRDVQDPSVTVRFPLADDATTSFLVWTTTPWTLPSNAAIAVHPELDYVRVRSAKHPGETFWLAAARAQAVVVDAEVIETRKGRDLVGVRVVPPFPGLEPPALKSAALKERPERRFTVLPGAFVTADEGTGVVHMAPCYGADDYELGVREGLPILAAVGRDGKFALPVGDVPAGVFFKEADHALIGQLKHSGRLFQRATMQHSYPFCWRCDTALLYYATPAWFIKTTAYRDAMVRLNREATWSPKEIGLGRFGEWLEGNIDWALSRDRYWGTPLPVWECEKCDKYQVVGSIAELRKRSIEPLPEPFDPHRPAIDAVQIRCDACGGATRRSPAVVDCWFDSGAMPFAQHGWPFTPESRAAVRDQFPADFIAEGLDQTRGWFYTLHAIATFLTTVDAGRTFEGEPLPLPKTGAYRACVVNGLVLDAQGRKMSKRLGNAVNPFEAVKQNGADSVRLLLLGSGAVHLNRRFDPDAMTAMRRQVVLPLANCLQFFATYADETAFDARQPVDEASLSMLDRWIRSRAYSLAKETAQCVDVFDLPGAIAALGYFAEAELSNWYVRRSRRRFQFGTEAERRASLATLRDVLGVAARCLAPFAPFAAEMLWHRLHVAGESCDSVHLQKYPSLETGREKHHDAALEQAMGSALVVARLARAVRERHKIRNTIPLPSIALLVPRGEEGASRFLAAVEEIVRDEVNVDRVKWEFYPPKPGEPHLFELKAKPNFPVLGKKAGKQMKAIQSIVGAWPTTEVLAFTANGFATIDVEGQALRLERDDLTIWVTVTGVAATETDRGITVALETNYDDGAVNRALARELVSAVNQIRRDAGFKLSQRCAVTLAASDVVRRLLDGLPEGAARDAWLAELRAGDLRVVDAETAALRWNDVELLDGMKLRVAVE